VDVNGETLERCRGRGERGICNMGRQKEAQSSVARGNKVRNFHIRSEEKSLKVTECACVQYKQVQASTRRYRRLKRKNSEIFCQI
jgi:hypothetical protein